MFFVVKIIYCLLDIFSQSDISEIVPEPKLTIEESIKSSNILKHQPINNNCKLQETCTTPKKNNEQCQFSYFKTFIVLV